MAKSFITVIIVLSTLLTLHTIAQETPCDATGTITRETYNSPTLGQMMFYSVYTPPCYDAAGDLYPVIYLMHGSNEDDGHWIRLGLPQLLDERILAGELPPVAVVMPFGNVIANRNRFDRLSWSRIFLDELLPHAETNYAISTDRASRVIGGISRGGFWAYQIAFSNPELFSAVGGHSAFFDLYHAEPADNPLDLALTQPDIGTMRLWLDRGVDDFAADGLDIMADRLTQRGVAVTYTVNPVGEHNNSYWSSHIGDYLDFYVADLQEEEEDDTQPAPIAFETNTPIATVTAPQIQTASELLLPVVAFQSLQTSISMQALQNIANGGTDQSLILTPEIAESIRAHPQVAISNRVLTALREDRNRYSLLPLSQIDLSYRILLVDGMPATTQTTYPFAGNTGNLSRVTLSGVTALARNTRQAIQTNGIQWASEALAPYVTQSDVFHISNEVSFTDPCPNSTGVLLGGSSSFCALQSHFDLFSQLGADVIELTGNHNNDYGYAAYTETLQWYAAAGLATVGGGQTLTQAREPYIITHNGNQIALVACNAAGPYYALVNEDTDLLGGVRGGAADCNWTWLESALPALAAQVDVLIVSVQYIEVEDYQPLQQQRIDFRRIANLGADVVIGSQAHKPQTFEFYPTQRGETAFIHYGLGNLYFDQPFWGNMRFFLDTLYISDGQLRAIELFPGIIDDLARPRLMTADERLNFMFFMLVEQNGF